MAFLRRKNKETGIPPRLPLPLGEDCVWSAWAGKAEELLKERSLITAVGCWAQAVARFDEKPKVYTKLHDDILSETTAFLIGEAREGRVISSHTFAEIDLEYKKRESEMPVSYLSEDVFYFAKEHLAESVSAEETSMVYISGAYAYLGIFRFSADPADVSERCREVYRLGDYAIEHCRTFAERRYAGKVKPGIAIEFISAVRDFFMYLADCIDAKLAELSPGEIESVKAERLKTREDLNDLLGDALQYCIQSSGSKPIKSEKIRKVLLELLGKYVDAFLDAGKS